MSSVQGEFALEIAQMTGAPTPKLARKPKIDVKYPVYSDPCNGCGLSGYRRLHATVGDPSRARLVVLLDRPSLAEAAGMRPFSDPETVAFLQAQFAEVGIPMEDCLFLYALHCSCWDKDIAMEDVRRCGNYLTRSLIETPCQTVLCMSTQGIRYMFGGSSLKTMRGKVLEFQKKKVVVAQLPFVARKDPFQLALFQNDLRRTASVMSGRYTQPTYCYDSLKKTDEIVDFCDFLLKNHPHDDPLGWDIETMWLQSLKPYASDPWSEHFRIWHMAVSWQDYHAVGFPFCPDPVLANKYGLPSIEQEPRLLAAVKRLLEGVPLVAHTKFDARGIYRYDIEVAKNLLVNIFDDSHAMNFLCNPEDRGGNDLKTLAWEHTTEGGYETGIGWVKTLDDYDWEKNIHYNCHDADLCRRIKNVLKPRLAEIHQDRVYDLLVRPFTAATLHMELDGVRMDVPFLQAQEQKEIGEMSAAMTAIRESRMVAKFVTFCKRKVEEASKEVQDSKEVEAYMEIQSAQDFKVKDDHIRILLYEVLKIPIRKRTDDEQPSVDADVLRAAVSRFPDIQHILDYRKHQKIWSTYLAPFIHPKYSKPLEEVQAGAKSTMTRTAYTKPDGKIHPKIHLDKDTGRSAITDPSSQNIKKDFATRRPYISRFPGGRLLSEDHSQAEIRMAACQCKDPVLIRALQHDIHWINLAVVSKIITIQQAQTALLGSEADGEALAVMTRRALIEMHTAKVREQLGPDHTQEQFALAFKLYETLRRTVAKKFIFGPMYGQTEGGIVEQLVNEEGMDRDEAERDAPIFLAALKSLYAVYFAWSESNIPEARRNNYVESVFGRRRPLNYSAILGDRRSMNERVDKMLGDLDRKVTNTKVQGPASDLCLLAAVHLVELFKKRVISPKTEVRREILQLSLANPLLDWCIREGKTTRARYEDSLADMVEGKHQSRLILPIHDSLTADCPAEEVSTSAVLMNTAMVHVPRFYIETNGVGFATEIEDGPSLAEQAKWKF
jgi:DNA polymerase I-like protein with 3'-5' exonuclease and polymerase domains